MQTSQNRQLLNKKERLNDQVWLLAASANTLIKPVRKAEEFLQGRATPKQEALWENWTFAVRLGEEIDPFSWLEACGDASRFYWSNRDSSFAVAACGISYCVPQTPDNKNSMQILQEILPFLEHTPVCHVLPFDASRPAATPMWQEFGQASLFMPLVKLIYANSEWKLCCHPFFGKDALHALACTRQTLKLLSRMTQPSGKVVEKPCSLPWDLSQSVPQQSDWQGSVRQAVDNIHRGEMQKTVLARQQVLQAPTDVVDPLQVFLQSKQHAPKNSFCFFWQPCQDQAFMGFSPERLYVRRGDHLETEAVAGTRPFGKDATQNAIWRKELLTSTKDGHEQRQVTEFLQRALGRFCSQRQTGERTVLQAGNVQHLVTPLSGKLNSYVTDVDILSCLHPTPAVCGYPRSQAKRFIAQQEGFDRGCYGGAIGYVSTNEAEFAVAIRSALLVKNQLHVFAGAGIVEGSDPASEWEETQSKMGVFAHLLT